MEQTKSICFGCGRKSSAITMDRDSKFSGNSKAFSKQKATLS